MATNKWLAWTPGIWRQAAVTFLTRHSRLLQIQQCVPTNFGGHVRQGLLEAAAEHPLESHS